MTRIIKCSRCGLRKSVPDDWNYKECGKCHTRTNRRLGKIREYKPREFKIADSFEFVSFKQFVKANRKYFKIRGKLTKEQKDRLRVEYEDRKKSWNMEHTKQVLALERLFHVREYPVKSKECLDVRMQARKHYLDGENWDITTILNHVDCDGCNGFINALRRGELLDSPILDDKLEAELRKEGYSSYEDWKRNMDVFDEAIRGQRR